MSGCDKIMVTCTPSISFGNGSLKEGMCVPVRGPVRGLMGEPVRGWTGAARWRGKVVRRAGARDPEAWSQRQMIKCLYIFPKTHRTGLEHSPSSCGLMR